IEKYCEIIYSDLNTIETNGGGSARCMLAEVFLPKNI
ncbi:MAG TPA: amidinotransferase, partial [Chryseobacterium sp.]|nr:amidinotransferase [Chryseobacterium sp.]